MQWDGTITIVNNDTHLYTRSDDGSRLWIDLNHNGVFESSGPELVDNNWGKAQGATLGPASAGLAPGSYAIRVQYEEGSGGNEMALLWDDGVSLNPGTRADVFHFEGTAGQRLFFDGMGPSVSANWYLYGPDNSQLGGANIAGSFEVTLNQSGTYILVLDGNNVAGSVPYLTRVVTTQVSNTPLTLGTIMAGQLRNRASKMSTPSMELPVSDFTTMRWTETLMRSSRNCSAPVESMCPAAMPTRISGLLHSARMEPTAWSLTAAEQRWAITVFA